MKAELRLVDHSQIAGAKVVEVHFRGKLVCAIYGADGPSIRIVSKHIHSHSVQANFSPVLSVVPEWEGVPGCIKMDFHQS